MNLDSGDILGDGILDGMPGDDFELPACKGSPHSAIDFLSLDGSGFWEQMTGDSLSPSLSLSPPLGSPHSCDEDPFEPLLTSTNSLQEAIMSGMAAVQRVEPVLAHTQTLEHSQLEQQPLHGIQPLQKPATPKLPVAPVAPVKQPKTINVKENMTQKGPVTPRAASNTTSKAATVQGSTGVARKTDDHAHPFKTCHLCGTARQSNHNKLVRCADRDSSRSSWCPFVCHQKCVERKVAGLVVDFVEADGTGTYKTDEGVFPFRCTVCTNLCTCDIGRGDAVMCYAGKKRNSSENKGEGKNGKGTGKERRKSSVSVGSGTPTAAKGINLTSNVSPANSTPGSAITPTNANKFRKTSVSVGITPFSSKPYAAKQQLGVVAAQGAAAIKSSGSSFEQLSVETIIRIFGFVDGRHWGKFAMVCKKWRHIVDMNRPGLKYVKRPERPGTILTMASRAGLRLQTLEFSDCHELDEATFAQIVRACPSVRHISLARCPQVKDSWLNTIQQLKRLQTLDLTDCFDLSGQGLSDVGRACPGLDTLSLSNASGSRWFSEKHALELIQFFPHLKQLGLAYQVDDACLHVLSQGLPFLERIDLSGCLIDSDAVSLLVQRCSYLNTLILRDCPKIGDEALVSVGQSCSQLDTLDISKCPSITPAGLVGISRGCPMLKTLRLSGCADGSSVSDEVLSELAQGCRLLEEVDLSDCTMLTDAGIGALATGCGLLRRLNLSGCWGMTDEVLRIIGANCPMVIDISICNCTIITSNGIRSIADGCPGLRRLDISGCMVLESALPELVSRCKGLQEVWITEAGSKRVWAKNPNGVKALVTTGPFLGGTCFAVKSA